MLAIQPFRPPLEEAPLLPVIEDRSTFVTMQTQWQQVAAQLNNVSPFASHSWFLASWDKWYVHRNAKLKVIELRSTTKHYGFLPLVLERRGFKCLWRRQLKLLLPCGVSTPVRLPVDWSGLLSDDNLIGELLLTIKQFEWDEIQFEGIENEQAEQLACLLARDYCKTQIKVVESAHCPLLVLPHNWDSFFASLSTNKRKEIRRNQKRLEQLGEISFEVLSNSDDVIYHLDASVKQSQIRYGKMGGNEGFNHRHFLDFHLETARTFATENHIRLFLLKINDKVIATLYLFKEGDTYHAYQGSYDHSLSKYGPGTLLDAWVIRYGLERDQVANFDFGYGQQDYKTRYPHTTRSVLTLSVVRQGWRSKLINAGKKAAQTLLYKRPFSKISISRSDSGLPIDLISSSQKRELRSEIDREKKTVILSIGHALSVAVGILTPMVLSRYFLVDDFGLYRQFVTIAWFVCLTAHLGMESGLFYFIKTTPERASIASINVALFSFVSAFFIATGMILGAEPLANLLESPQLVSEIPYIAAYFVTTLPMQQLPFYLLVSNKIRTATTLAIVNAIANATAAIVGCLYFGSVRSVIIGLSIWSFVKGVWFVKLHGTETFKEYWRHLGHHIELLKQQFRFGLPCGFGIFVNVIARVDRFIISSVFGLRSFTKYSVGCFDLPLLPSIFDSMSALMISDMVNQGENGIINQDKQRRAQAIWLSTVKQIAVLLIPAVLFAIVFAEPIIVSFFSETYRDSSNIFQLYMLSFFLLYIDADHVFQGLARNKTALALNTFGAIFSVCFMFIGLNFFGIMGVLGGRVIAESLTSFVRFAVLGRLLGTKGYLLLPWSTLARVTAAAGISVWIASYWYEYLGATTIYLKLIQCTLMFGFSYALLGLILGVLNFNVLLALTNKQGLSLAPALKKVWVNK